MIFLAILAAAAQGYKPKPPVYRPVPTPPPIVQTNAPAIHGQLAMAELPASKETMPYSIVGNWHVRVDLTLDGGCFANLVFDDYTYLRVAVDPTSKKVVVAVGNRLWRSLADGGKRPVELAFDGRTPWDADATPASMGNVQYLMFTIDKGFVGDLQDAQTMRVSSSRQLVGLFDVHGFRRAGAALADCQAKVDSAVDPFAKK